MILYLVFFVTLALSQPTKGIDEPCNLNDTQQTRGVCKDIQECTFAKEQLKAGVSPTSCQGRVVCCPTELTVGQKKCEEWKEYLQIPLALGSKGPDPITCLIPASGFISGGRDALPYEFPHVVALGWGSDERSLKFHCTGSLVSENYVVTAAHCITSAKGEPSFALVGDVWLTPEKANDFRKIVQIEKSIVHPSYKPPLTYGDIALVKLSTKLELSQYLLPVCLPEAGDKAGENDSVEAAGFGLLGPGEPQTNALQVVNLTYIQKKECLEFYNSASDRDRRFPEGLAKTQLCAGDKTDSGKDTCSGDSGGPLTINKDYRCVFYLVGLTSFGARLCSYGQPAVYTKVFSYNSWIESIVWGSQ
jgi:secreted trypsin-like serine protease